MREPASISASDIRERLRGTALPGGTAGKGSIPAAILVPVIERRGALSVLLTRRATHLKNHAGQVSFPGGRMEPEDTDLVATALRETEEEVGIRADQVEIAGLLQPVVTITGFTVTPVVGLVQPVMRLAIARSEVERAFEVPLAFLLDERNARKSERLVNGVPMPIVEFHFDSERIWGATANIVMLLRKKLL